MSARFDTLEQCIRFQARTSCMEENECDNCLHLNNPLSSQECFDCEEITCNFTQIETPVKEAS